VKRLYKSRNSKVIDGVCGGIAEYYEVDPVLIRLLAVLFLFVGGVTFIAYIVAMIIIPRRPWEESVPPPESAASQPVASSSWSGNRNRSGSLIIGIILVLFGIHFLMRNLFFFNPFYWWVWNVGWKYFWPCALIIFGLFILYRAAKRSEE
jgi:phage shock protein C